ncbi:MAG: hypothetical protein IPH83_13955 [Gammaproteobacteria bacterium]|nr:hypothetical protein [Gammaproteobacteria bacterium]
MRNSTRLATAIRGITLASIAAAAPSALALDLNVSGFVRQEMAYKLTDDENPFNQQGNVYNGKPTPNYVFNNILGIPVDVTRPDYSESNDWNLMATRGELDVKATFTENLTGSMKLRAYYDPGIYNDLGDVNQFEANFRGDCGSRLEVCGDDFMIDLPSFHLDYSDGPFWVRVGNQQIAWGESIFFRVLDVPNGLDLRRHSFLDWASEEYADERVPSLGVRGSYRFQNEWELEAFAQEFNPTIYAAENSPYNTIGTQFVRQEADAFDEVDDEWNFGMRLRGQIGELGLQFMAVSRRNPDGAFRWTTSKVNPFTKAGIPDPEAIPGSGITTGQLLSQTPFEPFTGQGIYTAREWFEYAGFTRLDGANLQQLLDDFPAAAGVAQPVKDAFGLGAIDDYASASTLLDTFFSQALGGLGDLRGHIERKYPREEIYGIGMNYMFYAEPDSFFDQLIVRFEATYTPDKEFTDLALAQEFAVHDEWATSLVFEKYQRFSENFPATYMVLQWLHKSESDMFGRLVDGYGGDESTSPPPGRDGKGFDAIAFALQQPSPTLMWRFDLAVLYDPEGGYLIQPGVRWKPSSAWTVETYANFLDGDNDDQMGTFSWGDELGMRIGYQF